MELIQEKITKYSVSRMFKYDNNLPDDNMQLVREYLSPSYINNIYQYNNYLNEVCFLIAETRRNHIEICLTQVNMTSKIIVHPLKDSEILFEGVVGKNFSKKRFNKILNTILKTKNNIISTYSRGY